MNGNWFTKTVGSYRGRWDYVPSITTVALPASVYGATYSFQCVGSAGTWSASGLPTGQSISSSGLITASNVTGSTSTVTLTLTTPNGRVATATMQSVVAQNVGLSTTSLTNGTEGVAGSQSVSMTGPGTLTVTATGLPIGASLSSSGTLSWTTAILAGIYAIRFTVTSSTAGAGNPVVLPWTVVQTAIVDDGAWSPLLRKRLA